MSKSKIASLEKGILSYLLKNLFSFLTSTTARMVSVKHFPSTDGFSLWNEVPDDIWEDASVVKVSQFHLGVESNCAGERLSSVGCDSYILTRPYVTDFIWKVNGVPFMASQPQSLGILTSFEAEGNNTHSYQVTAMNSLKTLGYHGFDSQ